MGAAPEPPAASEIRGVAFEADGGRASQAPVVAYQLTPNRRGDRIAADPIASTMTTTEGVFALDLPVSTADSPRTLGVELEVMGASGSVFYTLDEDDRVKLAHEGVPTSTGPVALQVGAGPQQISASLSEEVTTASVPATRVGDRALLLRGNPACRHPVWYLTRKKQLRNVPLQRLTTKRHSRMRYSWRTTTRTSSQAVTGVKVEGTWKWATAGFTASVRNDTSESNSAGLSKTARNRQSRLLKAQWEYRRYVRKGAYCDPVRKWIAYQWTGGSSWVRNPPTWRCPGGTYATMAGRTWTARTSGVVWASSFRIAGTGVSTRQYNSESHRLTVVPDPHERPPRICGDNDVPIVASRVQEVS